MSSPVPGARISRDFGAPGDYAAGYHTGRDYAADHGTPVLAAASGICVSAGPAGEYGLMVVLQTSGIRHLYCHLSRIDVVRGQKVLEGQRIGAVGSTGNSTGPHLHFEQRRSPYGYDDHERPTLDQQEDDMTPEQQQTLDNIAWTVGQIKGQTDNLNPRMLKPVDDTNWLLSNSVLELLKEISAKLDALIGR